MNRENVTILKKEVWDISSTQGLANFAHHAFDKVSGFHGFPVIKRYLINLPQHERFDMLGAQKIAPREHGLEQIFYDPKHFSVETF